MCATLPCGEEGLPAGRAGPAIIITSLRLLTLASSGTRFHEELLSAVIGDTAHQATFEAYAFLLAVPTWVTADTRGRVVLVGDALGVMFGVVTLSAKSEVVNKIAMELALHLAPLCISL